MSRRSIYDAACAMVDPGPRGRRHELARPLGPKAVRLPVAASHSSAQVQSEPKRPRCPPSHIEEVPVPALRHLAPARVAVLAVLDDTVGRPCQTSRVKVFISSVRRGLETERDALPGLIAAVGHEPSRFEDFTAQTVPSREACVRGVQEADVYLLVVGPLYGLRLTDTGQSPTHDEWVAATAAGIPRLVYVKRDVDFDEEQRAFLDQVESYEHGVFRDSYGEPTELLTKVAQKLREIASAPGPLVFAPLSAPITVEWLRKGEPWTPSVAGVLEVHAVPAAHMPLSGRQLLSIAESVPVRLRTSPLVGQSRALSLSRDAGGVSVELPQESNRGRGAGAHPAELLGARVFATGQVSTWAAL